MTDGAATIAVVGGGISGLAAVHRLLTGGTQRVVLLEREQRLGGKVLTERQKGYVMEAGPDSFVVPKGSVLDLTAELGIAQEVVTTRPERAGTFIWWDGRLHRLPAGLLLMLPSRIWPVLSSSLLSWSGKLHFLTDLVRPRGGRLDETLASFVTRRMGREVLDRIADPLVAGIHATTPAEMSLRASFPRLLEIEERQRSMILAGRSRPTEGTPSDGPGHFGSFGQGMGRLVQALVGACHKAELRTGTGVDGLRKRGSRFELRLETGGSLAADAVILTVPSTPAGRLLRGLDVEAVRRAAPADEVPMASVHLAFPASEVPDLPGYGFVVPSVAGRAIEGISVVSSKWTGRTPDRAHVLWRVFVGGPRHAELVLAGQESVGEAVRRELRAMLDVRAEPILERIHLWRRGIHRYRLGHVDFVTALERELEAIGPLYPAGSAYHGIGLNECVASGRRAAERALRSLGSPIDSGG